MGQQAQQQQGDNAFAPIWIMLIVFIVAFVIWKMGHQHIVAFIFYLNILQAKAVNFVIGQELLSKEIYLMQTVNPKAVDIDQLLFLTKNVGDYTRYPFAAVLVFCSFLLYTSNIKLKFRKTYSMNSLRAQEQYNWPAIMPIVKEDLVSQDINKGPWAMALTPMEFARKYDLLRKDDKLLDSPSPGMEMTAALRKGDAKRVFTLQLGAYWDGFENLPAHVRALAAVFISRLNRDRDSANNILSTIDKSVSIGKPTYDVGDATLKKYKDTDVVRKIVSNHAYVLTAMASLLSASRNDGVVPSAEFLWLKPVDRRLWYMLNCVGRQTPYAEVGGVFAHWKAELAMGRRSLVPMIDEAIKALDIAIKEVKLSPDEMEKLEP